MTETGISSKMWSEEYERKVIRILQGCESVTKNREYYHIKSSFKLENFAGITKICRKKDNKIMTTKTNAWQIIRDLHTACGHKGEKETYKKVAEHYANIPMVIIKQFIEQCERCTEKTKKVNSTGIVVRPIISKDLNSRAQIDLIDYQSLPDGQYKFILHYKEHLTKYSILRPLICKRAVEVAKELLNIFLDFGAPTVLQSDNGKEFTANIIKELGTLWPTLVLVNGRPRQPQSQGSVERANATVKNALVAWMRDNKTSSWSLGLKFVQWGINTTYHDAIKMEPYKAMFGQPPKLGLGSKIPQEFLAAISNGITEENMDEILKIPDNESCKGNDNGHEIMKDTMPENFEIYNIEEDLIYNQEVTTDTTSVSTAGFGEISKEDTKEFTPETQIETVQDEENTENYLTLQEVSTTEFQSEVVVEHINNNSKNIVILSNQLLENPIENEDEVTVLQELFSERTLNTDIVSDQPNHPAIDLRNLAYRNILQQAQKMTDLSNKKLGSFSVGDNVLLGISEFDRGRGDPANLIGMVIAEKEGKFRIGTKHGIVDNWLEKNSLQPTKFKRLKLSDVPDHEHNIRMLVRKGSVGSGQGYKRCNCTKTCNSMRCKCLKAGFMCNSACHAGRSCTNT